MRKFLTALLFAALALVLTVGAETARAQTSVDSYAISTSNDPWTAYYYNNPDWSGSPVQIDTAPYLQFDWRYGSPGPNVPVDHFTARFDANGYFKAQPYLFKIVADDEFVLMINGAVRLDTRGKYQHAKTFERVITFNSAKTRPVTVFFRELTEVAYIRFSWQPYKGETGGGSGGGNPSQCFPASAKSVTTQYGNYDACIQNNWHQSSCFTSTGTWDSPNMGSISSEPKIEIWANCTPDQNAYFQVSCDPNVAKKSYRCSKTGAGWYPY